MTPFRTLTGVAAALPLENVDTDKIIPARFLKTIERRGLGVFLFDALRRDPTGEERPDFVLNQPPFRAAEILITYDNFGCGSSREHALWALADFGIRCVIAPSFADIFAANALKNGVLLVRLPKEACEALMSDSALGANGRLTVDLERQEIVRPDGEVLRFETDPFVRSRLLEGLDEIGETLKRAEAISAFEDRRRGEAGFPEIRL